MSDDKPQFTDDTVPEQSAGYELQKTACCYLLREQGSNKLVRLNDPSALIWRICTGEWNVADIVDALKENYPDAAATMQQHVTQALEQLHGQGVIQIKAAA